MSAPTYITFQLRRPSRDGEDPGVVDEAWFITKGDIVQLTDRDGHPLRGDENRRRLKNSETAREAAVQLLRSKTGARSSRPFNRVLRYPKIGMA
jgi:hypothetical protein